MTRVLFYFLILLICNVYSYVTINSYDEECNLSPQLLYEIASYKNITDKIMNEINNTLGKTMYSDYSKFIDEFGARPAGSQVLEEAIDYMINLTNINGLESVTTEDVQVPYWIRGSECATMIQPRFKPIAILGFGPSVSTPAEGITAEVIVVNSFEELENKQNEEVNGKIVVYDVPYTTYGATVAYRLQGASRASQKGAVASLVRSVTPFSLYTLHTGFQRYAKGVKKIPTATITHEDADFLKRLQDLKKTIVLNIKMFSTSTTKISRNTLVDLVGRENSDKYVIVSGHIDSWDVGQGAMDDGGGMFISWYAPVILNKMNLKPRRTLRAILWTSEEPGLVGAFDYLKRHTQNLSDINFIMESDEGTFKPLGLDISGSKNAVCIIAEILKLFSPIDKLKESVAVGSDISIFNRKGVPGAALLNQNERYFWYHHSSADTMDVQNMNDVIDCAAFWAAFSFVISDLSVDIPRL